MAKHMVAAGRLGLERHAIALGDGETLHMLSKGDGRVVGYFQCLPDGRTRHFVALDAGVYRATGGTPIYPGPVSIMRALVRGEL